MLRLILVCLTAALVSAGSSRYKDQYQFLLEHVSKALPLPNDGSPVSLKLGISLLSIDHVDQENHQVSVVFWKHHTWTDMSLTWAPKKIGNINLTTLNVEANKMWVPDTALYNSVGPEVVLGPELVVVSSSGMMYYIPTYRVTIPCDVSGVESYSGASCALKIGSWTYNANLLSLAEATEDSFKVEEVFESSRYEIVTKKAKKVTKKYDCCPENYENMVFSFTFREKAGSHHSPSSHSHSDDRSFLRSLLIDH